MIDGDEKASLEQLLPALELIAVKNSKMINMPRHDIVWGQGVEIFGHFHTLEKNIIKTFKTMAANCKCMLCRPWQSGMPMPWEPPEPTILCEFIDYWRSMYNICCCRRHKNCDKKKDRGECRCPKCCKCWEISCDCGQHTYYCENCKMKKNKYFTCSHQGASIDDHGLCATFVHKNDMETGATPEIDETGL